MTSYTWTCKVGTYSFYSASLSFDSLLIPSWSIGSSIPCQHYCAVSHPLCWFLYWGDWWEHSPFPCLLIPFPDHPDMPHGAHFFGENYGLQDWLSSDFSFPCWWEERKGDWELPHFPQKSTAVLFLPPLEGKKIWRLITEFLFHGSIASVQIPSCYQAVVIKCTEILVLIEKVWFYFSRTPWAD